MKQSYNAEDVEEIPTEIPQNLIGNRLSLMAKVKSSESEAALTIIAYDALRTQIKGLPVFCLVRVKEHGTHEGQSSTTETIIHQGDYLYLIGEPILLESWWTCVWNRPEQGLVYLKRLGDGFQGVVHLAHDVHRSTPDDLKFSAVKEIHSNKEDKESLTHLQNEIRHHTIASTHPNVVTLHRVFNEHGVHYLVMDYVPGGDLDQFFSKNPKFYLGKTELVRSLLLQLLDAIYFLHANGIYHG